MNIQEIIESEKRDENNLYDIHFYMEGKFWRAYEWSAYLSRNFPSTLKDEEKLKPLKKLTKHNENGYVLIGLQLSSFDKYFPDVTNNQDIFNIEDKHIIIHSKSFFENKNFTEYETILNEWKSSIKLSDNEKKKLKETNTECKTNHSAESILKEIATYPLERKNLIEILQYLSYIKDCAIKITK